MFKVNNKEARTTPTVSLFLTLSLTLPILVSLLLMLTLNIFPILHDVKKAEIRALYWKKERKVTLTSCKLKCFSSRIQATLRTPPPSEYRPIKFFLCPYNIRPGRINGIYGIWSIASTIFFWFCEKFVANEGVLPIFSC